MADQPMQSKWIATAYEDGARSPNSQCTIMGTATLAAGTVEVPVPFGTAKVTGVSAVISAAAPSATGESIGSDGVITGNHVTFVSVGVLASTKTFFYTITGVMDEAAV